MRPTQEVRPPREGTENYETILSESRTGANVTEGELLAFDALLRDFTAKGQSVHAAMASNPDKFIVSEKTVYRYINSGLLSTKRGDLPRACMLRPRKGKGVEHRVEVDKTCRVGRTREDCELPEIVMRRKAR